MQSNSNIAQLYVHVWEDGLVSCLYLTCLICKKNCIPIRLQMELKDVINVIYLIHPVEFDTTWQACMSHHFFLLPQPTLRFFELPEAKLSLFHKMPHSTAMGWLIVSAGWLRTMACTWTHYLFPNSDNEESYKGESMCLTQNTTTAWQSWVQKRTTKPWSTAHS